MLCLKRLEGETIEVSGPAKIIVNRVSGQVVHLGIEAPESTVILRGEVAERERESQQGEQP